MSQRAPGDSGRNQSRGRGGRRAGAGRKREREWDAIRADWLLDSIRAANRQGAKILAPVRQALEAVVGSATGETDDAGRLSGLESLRQAVRRMRTRAGAHTGGPFPVPPEQRYASIARRMYPRPPPLAACCCDAMPEPHWHCHTCGLAGTDPALWRPNRLTIDGWIWSRHVYCRRCWPRSKLPSRRHAIVLRPPGERKANESP